ncbi:MAG: formylglycine-generating enzyme family protein [Chitinispirillaceae bacterium]|nr:formylglycine-generating enzyme family protein [Chitinispirillaceae bacterium]
MKPWPVIAVFLAAGIAGAQNLRISLNGMVFNGAGEPAVKARVWLKKYPALVEYTDSSGKFMFDTCLGCVSARQGKTIRSATSLPDFRNIDGKGLFICGAGAQGPMSVELFSCNGAKLFSTRIVKLPAGREYCLPYTPAADGLRLLRVTVDNRAAIGKVLPGMNGFIIFAGARTDPPAADAAASAVLIDTLIVYKKGYRQKLRGLTGHAMEGIAETLSISNVWQPSEAPEKSGRMVKILSKGHDFEMGQPVPDIFGSGVDMNEQPVHTVEFTYDFWMDSVEVTQRDFDTLMKKYYTQYTTPAWSDTFGKGDNYPAYLIHWVDAALYCNARSKSEGLDTVFSYSGIDGTPGSLPDDLTGLSISYTANGYRMPTEAEWEYACKGGTFTDLYWGKDYFYYRTVATYVDVDSFAVWRGNAFDKGMGKEGFGVHPIATKSPNRYHLYDMSGSLTEYCCDGKTPKYSYAKRIDPVGPSDDRPAVRGGSWVNELVYLRSANRTFDERPLEWYQVLGFRTVRRVPNS